MAVRKKAAAGDGKAAATKACIQCAEPIAPAARKCTHCGSAQGWRRFFPFSATILSLLIALFAVLGQSFSAIRDAMHRPGADIGFALQSSAPHRLAILAFNDGDRSGTVSMGLLTLADGRKMYLSPAGGAGTQLVPPKSSVLLHYVVGGDPGSPADPKAVCKLALLISDEHGVSSFADREIPCGVLIELYSKFRMDENGKAVRVN
jgi:hypothetical protein